MTDRKTILLLLIVAVLLARISRRLVKRSAGGAGDGGVFDPTGAELGSAARRAPGGEKTSPAPVHRALQPRGGEKCGLEVLLMRRSGLLEWVAGGPHSMEEIRGLVTDWRVLTSVVLVSVVLLLAVKWIQLGTAGRHSGVGE